MNSILSDDVETSLVVNASNNNKHNNRGEEEETITMMDNNNNLSVNEMPMSPQPSKEKDPIKLWGVKLLFSERSIFWLLASGALFAYLGFTTVQEYVFRNHAKEAIGFRFGGVVTLVTSFTYALLGFLELCWGFWNGWRTTSLERAVAVVVVVLVGGVIIAEDLTR